MADPEKDGLEEGQKRRESDSIKVAIISGTGTGDGNTAQLHGKIIQTPGSAKNIVPIIVTPIIAILVRFGHAYLSAVVALMGGIPLADKIGDVPIVPFHDFTDLFVKSLTLAAAGPSLELLRDVVTIFSRLKEKYPLLTGNV